MKKTFYICDRCGVHIKDDDVIHAALTTQGYDGETYNASVDLCSDCNLNLLTSWAKSVGDNEMLHAMGKLVFTV